MQFSTDTKNNSWEVELNESSSSVIYQENETVWGGKPVFIVSSVEKSNTYRYLEIVQTSPGKITNKVAKTFWTCTTTFYRKCFIYLFIVYVEW